MFLARKAGGKAGQVGVIAHGVRRQVTQASHACTRHAHRDFYGLEKERL